MSATAEATVPRSVLAGTSGLLAFGVVAYMAAVLVDQFTVVVVAGVLTGLGSALLVGFLLQSQSEDDHGSRVGGGLHHGAAGFALFGAGLVTIVLTVLLEDAAIGVGVAVVIAAVEYVVVAQILPGG